VMMGSPASYGLSKPSMHCCFGCLSHAMRGVRCNYRGRLLAVRNIAGAERPRASTARDATPASSRLPVSTKHHRRQIWHQIMWRALDWAATGTCWVWAIFPGAPFA